MILYPEIDEELEHVLIEANSIDKKSTDEIVSQSENFYNDDLIEFENLNNSCNAVNFRVILIFLLLFLV